MIRPLLLLLTVVLAGQSQLSAQNDAQDTSQNTAIPYRPFKTSIGPKVFLGLSTFSANGYKDILDRIRTTNGLTSNNLEVSTDFTVGGGLSFETKLSERFSLLIEPVFMLYSTKLNSNRVGPVPADSTIRSEIQLKNDFIEVPLLIKFVLHRKSRVYLLAGGAADFVTGGRVNSIEQTTNNTLVDYSSGSAKLDSFTKIRFNANFGFGITLPAAGHSFNLDFRYALPLTGTSLFTSDPEYFPSGNAMFFAETPLKQNEAKYAITLDNFKLGTIGLHLSYGLFGVH